MEANSDRANITLVKALRPPAGPFCPGEVRCRMSRTAKMMTTAPEVSTAAATITPFRRRSLRISAVTRRDPGSQLPGS